MSTERTFKTTVSVGGMSCAACVRRVERALAEVEGVIGVSVNLATARATIDHKPEWRWSIGLQINRQKSNIAFFNQRNNALETSIWRAW